MERINELPHTRKQHIKINAKLKKIKIEQMCYTEKLLK